MKNFKGLPDSEPNAMSLILSLRRGLLLLAGAVLVVAGGSAGMADTAPFALTFHGTNDFVTIPHQSEFNAFPLTVTAWIKTTQATGEVGIINKFLANSYNGWQVFLYQGSVRAWYMVNPGNIVWDGAKGLNGGPVTNGLWHHVAFTVDSGGGKLYVDGVLKDSLPWIGAASACTTTQEVSFARNPGSSGSSFLGSLDEVTIWTVAQPQSWILTNLNRGMIGSESGLLAYYRLNEGAFQTAYDTAGSGGNNYATLTNGPSWTGGLILRPAAVTRPATSLTKVSATLNGVANPNGTNATGWFQWGTSISYGNATSPQSIGAGVDNVNFGQELSGLIEGTLYHYRVVVTNSLTAPPGSSYAPSYGVDQTFVAVGTNMIVGRMNHTATLLPDGRVLAVGGKDDNGIEIASTELFDPATGTWALTGSLNAGRYSHTATLLPNGKVLVVGGTGVGGGSLASAELYDPVTGLWTLANPMADARANHTASLLAHGKVLVAGGWSLGWIGTAELYNPANGTWAAAGTLAAARYQHTATLLPNGKLLVAGGMGTGSTVLSSAELFDPVGNAWTAAAPMSTNRYIHTATLLATGKVLIAGGENSNFSALRNSELYDPVLGTWSVTTPMLNGRHAHTATLLPNGQVFANAGAGAGNSGEIYNPATATWTSVSGVRSRQSGTATLLANGKVLAAGGIINTVLTDAQLFDFDNGFWSASGGPGAVREFPTATLLSNGKVLLAGGDDGFVFPGASYLYDPVSGTSTVTGTMSSSGREAHTATVLTSGNVLVTGGNSGGSEFNDALVYYTASGTWSNTAAMTAGRYGHTATLLFSGKVLTAGGYSFNNDLCLAGTELYDPLAVNWTNGGLLKTPRAYHTATLLPDGRVLVAGGLWSNAGFSTNSAELYDPIAGTWTYTGSMSITRSGHIAVLLPNGKVLVAGGSSMTGRTAAAELYEPATGTWKTTGSMTSPRVNHTAVLLPNGKVLVAGGTTGSGSLATCELYDPELGAWTATGALAIARKYHAATVLPNGRILVYGGLSNSSLLNSVEVFDAGQGITNSWRPQITSLTTPLPLGNNLVISGAQFRGVSEASGGNGSQDSPADYPVVQMRALESGLVRFLQPTNWSTNIFTSLPINSFPPGWALVSVTANGISSTGALLSISKPLAMVTFSNLTQTYDHNAKTVSVYTVPAGLSVLVTYNGSTIAPTNVGDYTVVGTINDAVYQGAATNTFTILGLGRKFGVDVSHFQNESGVPPANWAQLYAEGRRFAFIKSTEGLTGPDDPTVFVNLANARQAGLLAGVYHFAHAENRPTTNGAVLEAGHLLGYVGSAIGPGYLRPVLDIEFTSAVLTAPVMTDWVIAFSNEIIRQRGAGAAPIIYCTLSFAINQFDSRLAGYDLWIRSINGTDPGVANPTSTGVFTNWSFWQYSVGSAGGISPLDLNVCHDEYKPLASFLIPAASPAFTLGGVNTDGSGFHLSFSNVPGTHFTVLSSTNLTLPLSNWMVVGSVPEISPGLFQFTDSGATNRPRVFYQVRSP